MAFANGEHIELGVQEQELLHHNLHNNNHPTSATTADNANESNKRQQLRDLRDASVPDVLAYADAPSPDAVDYAPPTSSGKPKKIKPPRRATEDSPNICHECKTTDSKLWRRGPDGHLMCNACGLRWRRSTKAKDPEKAAAKRRKQQSLAAANEQVPVPMPLPESSMLAAQRHSMLTPTMVNSFQAQDYGQIRYQPQQAQPQAHQPRFDPPKKEDPPIDPAIDDNNQNVDPSLQDLPVPAEQGSTEPSAPTASKAAEKAAANAPAPVEFPLPEQAAVARPEGTGEEFSGLSFVKAFVDDQ